MKNVVLETAMPNAAEVNFALPATAENLLVEPTRAISEALARVQEAAIEVQSQELRECLEEAIEAIDTVAAIPTVPGTADLNAVADALEGALDELEHGKVANLRPVIEQAQSIIGG